MTVREKAWRLLIVFATAPWLFLSAQSAPVFPPGDEVEVEYGGAWYEAKVLELRGKAWLIRYDGYDSSWDELVGPERIRKSPESREPGRMTRNVENEPGAYRDEKGDLYYDPREITVFREGKAIGRIESSGNAYVGARVAGSFDWTQSYVRTSSGHEWELTARGDVKRDGTRIGRFEEDGTLRVGAGAVGSIEYGVVYLAGREWGSVALYDGSEPDLSPVVLYLAAFFPDFGFPGAESRLVP